MKVNYNILLIDDNVIDQIVTIQLLKKKLNLTEITTVNNGEEGIEWLLNYKKDIEKSLIILLDIKMPEMDGFEFLTKFDTLSDEIKKETLIFMLSSTLDPNDIIRAQNNKYVKTLLSKPLSCKEFSSLIHLDL
ncbi:Response regulator receiver domain-containing protein [Flavobacterium gillisiae]|uniref:Response regulator receiver domain-containing protein n=1 Tax=Flavobacterium gillisiae TaxID=150146 RepID=A0A1H4CRT7_9FLAO|nr:response regulator [Flavobacterium gillisiae]SEA63091.1 Response regulator receiver domain-containing protein [Flavobacterium gillisiae]